MPGWEPNWQDVQWNHGAAQEAIQTLRGTGDSVERAMLERLRSAREAQVEWRGRRRQEFDGQLEQIQRRANELVNELRSTAEQIARADQAAYEEQQRRKHDRERWREEQEAEERARLLLPG